MEKRSRFIRLLLVIDQFFNVLLWNDPQDETISSHLYRRIHIKKNATWFDKLICKFLGLLDTNHCHRARGE